MAKVVGKAMIVHNLTTMFHPTGNHDTEGLHHFSIPLLEIKWIWRVHLIWDKAKSFNDDRISLTVLPLITDMDGEMDMDGGMDMDGDSNR